jgi:hypothetical protein
MKKVFFTLICIACLTAGVMAQGSKPSAPAGDCFTEYNDLFRSRGAKPVTDGVHQCVIAIRKGSTSHCFTGKIEVKNGEFVPPVYIENADGTFDEIKRELIPAYQSVALADRRKIVDGTSITLLTTEGEEIKAFLTGFLQAKPKAHKAAPSAKTY